MPEYDILINIHFKNQSFTKIKDKKFSISESCTLVKCISDLSWWRGDQLKIEMRFDQRQLLSKIKPKLLNA